MNKSSLPRQNQSNEVSAHVELEAQFSTEEVIRLLVRLLNEPKFRHTEELEAACEQYPDLRTLTDTIMELRTVAASLSKGVLDERVASRGYVLSCIKALQSNLNHLVWQLSQVSKGDFSQRIDFLGDFSESFNAMCLRLEGQTSTLTELARHDSLTKLANRGYLDEYLEDLFENSQSSGAVFSFMMIDIDFFKSVNDKHGHDVGDKVLEQTAEYLRQVFRSSDFLARYGGEEFVAVLPHITLDQAKVVAERAREFFDNNPISIDESLKLPITISIGFTQNAPTDAFMEDILKRSDEALYRAKANGRNRIEWSLVLEEE